MVKLIVMHADISCLLIVPYNAARHPGNTTIQEFLSSLEQGANCELFALAAVRLGGFYAEEKRSIELWHDEDFTREAGKDESYKPFDIFFFLPKGADPHKVEKEVAESLKAGDGELNGSDLSELKRFHLGVYIGTVQGRQDCIFHLPKPGPSVIWPLSDFAKSKKEYWLFKVKRPIRRIYKP